MDARGRLVCAGIDLGPAEDFDEFVYQAPWAVLGKGESLFFLRDDQGAEWVFVYSLRSPEPPTKHRWGPLRVRDLALGRRIPRP